MCTHCRADVPYGEDCAYRSLPAPVEESTSTVSAGPLDQGDMQEIADYLVTGFWQETEGRGARSFNIETDGTITVNITRLTNDGKALAQAALEAWTDATGIQFVLTSSNAADIVLDDTDSFSAYASSNYSTSGEIFNSFVNIGRGWNGFNTEIDGYTFQTYIHEIGHALGLGHAGPYNGNGSFSQDASFDADSWQATTMSYFAQTENPNVDASFAYAITTMPADILAIRTLYGTSGQTRTGDTTYWNNSTAGGVLDDLTSYNNPVTATIIDDGGHDTLDFSNETVAQTIHAYGGGVSDVGGLTGNLIIYYDTVIEDVVGGSGADVIHGSDVANSFVAGGGNDTLWLLGGADAGFGNAGDDTLYGGDGDDELRGGSGGDLLVGGDGVDTVVYTTTAAVTLSLRTDQVQDTGEGADTLRQIENAETGAGNDLILGSAADNRLSGGDGDDRLEGGNGNDTLIGGSGNDVLYGEAGDDTLEGGAGDDDLFGADGADTLRGQDGDDLLQGGFGDDTIAGGAGRDIALFRKPGADATVDLAISGVQDTGYGLDTLSDIEVLISGAGADRLSGDNAANNIQARDGADEVFGRGGDDLLFGGTGDDRISGGSGDDRIHGRQDDDILTGGGGADIFVFETSDGDDRITDFEDGLDLLRFRDVSGFDDVEIIDRGADTEIRAGGTTVLLEDVAAGLLGADDFDFV